MATCLDDLRSLCRAGLADAAHAVDGALSFDDDGAFGGEVLAKFGEELIAAFEQGAEGGVGEVGGPPGEDGDFKLDGLDGLLQAVRRIGGLVPQAEGAVGVPAVLSELGDEGLLPLGQLRWLGREGDQGEDLMAKTWLAEIWIPFFATHLFARRMGELLLPVLGQHAFDVMCRMVEAGLDDRLDAALAKNPGDSFREGFQPVGGAGDEDAGLSRGGAHAP